MEPLYPVAVGGRRKKRSWVTIIGAVLLILVILGAAIVGLVGLGIAGLFFPRDNAGAYFIGNEGQGGAYQFYQANDQINPSDIDISGLGSISNENTKDAGLLWFQSVGILGTHGQQIEAQHIRNGMGTSFLIRDGNAEITEGSLWVKGTIYADNFEIPNLTQLIKSLTEQLDIYQIRTDQLQRQLDDIASLPQQWDQWKEQQQ